MDRKISEIMTASVFTLTQNDTVMNAAQIMKENDIGFIPIVDGKKVQGVVTDRDLVMRGYAEGLPADTKLSEVMTKSCITVEKDISIIEAANIMAEKQIRRLGILDNGNLAGVCALGDLSTSYTGKTEAGDALSKISEPAY